MPVFCALRGGEQSGGEGRAGEGTRLPMEMETFWLQGHSHKIIFPKISGKVRFFLFTQDKVVKTHNF